MFYIIVEKYMKARAQPDSSKTYMEAVMMP